MILISGASSGIGEACARTFARDRENLILLARRKDRLESLARELRQEHSVEIHPFVLDVRSRKAIENFARENSHLLGRLKTLINNAGLAKGLDPVQSANLDDWEQMIDTNLRGLVMMTRILIGPLIQNQGHIVNIGSVAGRHTYPKGNVYCATKYAVRAFSEAIRSDLTGTGVRVTEIQPGMTDTEFSLVRLGDRAKACKVYEGMTPLSAQDIANSVSWCLKQPPHVNIQEVLIYPTDQSSVSLVHRRT